MAQAGIVATASALEHRRESSKKGTCVPEANSQHLALSGDPKEREHLAEQIAEGVRGLGVEWGLFQMVRGGEHGANLSD